MRKITNFIVNKRNYILMFFIIISGILLYIGTKVSINNDISKYLPADSETKIGMNIMENSFKKEKKSSLYIMFEDLDEQAKQKTFAKLLSISNVSSVDYDESEKYNNENYTLYILNVEDYSDSIKAKETYQQVKEIFKNEKLSFSGSIYNSNKPVISIWILIIAVIFATIILIIMCESYLEPFLFLFVIALAIFLNNGTNIIFSSVSNITSSISAILQLALSMDYSIILMNRYSQEKKKFKDNQEAMKEALFNSSKSIASSSVTTIVGLLALVFMSFTIGKDLGLVLAKGVLFSLLSIFLCLPTLILLFDKAIQKTKKKQINLNLVWLGKETFKFRYILIIIFIVLFIISYFLKGNLDYLYTGAEQNKISKHFNINNQIAIIYNNEYEEAIAKYCKELKNSKVNEALCYGNTINDPLKYNELNNKLKELSNNIEVDETLIKIIYYYSNNELINNTMTFNEFVSFIENTIYHNEDFRTNITSETKESLVKLKYFITETQINKERDYYDISNILGIGLDKIKSLYILHHSNNVNIKLNINEFINFLNNDVLTNTTYASSIDDKTQKDIKTLIPFIDKNNIMTKANSEQLARLLGINEASVKQLLILFYQNNDSGYQTNISNFLLGIDASRDYLPNTDLSKIESLLRFAKNENNINGTKLSRSQLKDYLKNNESLIDLVYLSYKLPVDYRLTPQELLNTIIDNFASYLSTENLNQLKLVSMIIDDTLADNKILYNYKEMSSILGLRETESLRLYSLVGNIYNYEYKLSPQEFVKFLLINKDNPFVTSNLNKDSINKLILLNNIMDGIVNNTTYTYKKLSSFLGIDTKILSLLYSLYDFTYLNDNYKINLNNFIEFILNDVINDQRYKDNIEHSDIIKLENIMFIMESSLNNLSYNNKELYTALRNLDNNLNENLIDLIYIYHGSVYNYDNNYIMTIEKFVNYLNNNILVNNLFKEFIREDMKFQIIESQKIVDNAKKLLVSDNYSRAILNTEFDVESEETFSFIQSIKNKLNSENKEIYIIGDSPMAYDMDSSFGSELNFITVLTMFMIFIVVAFTFKSLSIPLILILIIECAVFITMSILSLAGSRIYFIAILIVQSILMGATIDYAIVYTSYYKEYREDNFNIIDSLINAYNNSVHTILTSASILIIVTFIVGMFAEPIAAKICMTLAKGTLCSLALILFILPGVLAVLDKYIIKNKKMSKQCQALLKHKRINN